MLSFWLALVRKYWGENWMLKAKVHKATGLHPSFDYDLSLLVFFFLLV